MNKSDFDSFSKIISSIGDMYGKTVSDMALSIWWNALNHLELSAIREALSAHIRNPDNGQFMPKPADVIRLLGGTTTDQANIAWSKVDKAVKTIGAYRDIAFDDPIIHKVIEEMGGWHQLGQRDDREWGIIENRFITRYRSYIIFGVDTYPGILIGTSNMYNMRNGYDLCPTYLFGDPEKARLTIANAKQAEQTTHLVASLLE